MSAELRRRAGLDDVFVEELARARIAVASRPIDRLSAAHDASHYRLVPELVATPSDAIAVGSLLNSATRHGRAVTFRSGGTSLSGQASSSRIVADTRRNFRAIMPLEDGERVRVQPGATVRAVNARLARYRRKLGPDPASEIACTIGGVIANNSSGMSCGIEANAYRTLDSMVLVLASGTIVDTADPRADEHLRATEPEVYEGLLRIRDRIRAREESVALLRRLHSIKNTMGYGLNSFLDFDNPVAILEHLTVGSEGTLAFVAEATLRTLPVADCAATGLLVFPNLGEATKALPALVSTRPTAVELLDAASLRVAKLGPRVPAVIANLEVREHAALLVEYQEQDPIALAERLASVKPVFSEMPLCGPHEMSRDSGIRSRLWHIRKGLFTAVAGNRPSGTSALLEDIAVPVPNLYSACVGLVDLFDRYRYEGSVIFGHAKDGNVHFMLNERFDDPASLRRYEDFTEDLVCLVLALGGTLKAEHGTGRVMAPFVRRQYGDELYEVMWEVKDLLDPHLTLNPGVLLDDNPRAHVTGLKTAPLVEEEVDRCVECGYCEPVCPSRDVTTTPRERIVLRREMQRAAERGDSALLRALEADYDYEATDTCAADGMCETACPVLINTGDLVRRLRSQAATTAQEVGWRGAAKHWGAATRTASAALSTADVLPASIPSALTSAARRVTRPGQVPQYSRELPRGGKPRPRSASGDPAVVLFASCTQTIFGPADRGDGVARAFLDLCERAGVGVATPEDMLALCCGTPWKSKGLRSGWAVMRDKATASLRRATDNGRLPVVCDASSCTEGIEVLLAQTGLEVDVVDAVAFIDQYVLPRLPPVAKVATLVLHPTCSSTRLGINDALRRVAYSVANEVVVPHDWNCCAFAGDRGLLHPELTAAATASEAIEVTGVRADVYASLNRTCELGMTRATGQPYRHILEILAKAIR